MQKFELIIAIINRGFSEIVMDSARAKGATGGTILNARGTVVDEAQTIMGISIQPEKEVILILAKKEKRNDIMSAICQSAGLNTMGKGIIFSMLVEDVLGISLEMENFDEIIENSNAVVKEKHPKKHAHKVASVKPKMEKPEAEKLEAKNTEAENTEAVETQTAKDTKKND